MILWNVISSWRLSAAPFPWFNWNNSQLLEGLYNDSLWNRGGNSGMTQWINFFRKAHEVCGRIIKMPDLEHVVPSMYRAVLSDVITQDTTCFCSFYSFRLCCWWNQVVPAWDRVQDTGDLVWPFCQPVQTGCPTKWLHPQHTTGHNLFEEGWQHQFMVKGHIYCSQRENSERLLLQHCTSHRKHHW